MFFLLLVVYDNLMAQYIIYLLIFIKMYYFSFSIWLEDEFEFNIKHQSNCYEMENRLFENTTTKQTVVKYNIVIVIIYEIHY